MKFTKKGSDGRIYEVDYIPDRGITKNQIWLVALLLFLAINIILIEVLSHI